ncbi:uncharacterized protein LOC112563201 isoform X2 [Pomacea canaliculata]|nr:uncharacterized protein LOC112563201 isoform X2 [Pomacea canaliculata]XP_025092784.1 uncharacterized protein LOC112563201 isoform X2 [Pomacea canaliculata]
MIETGECSGLQSASGSCSCDARDQELGELEDMEQERMERQTRKQEVYHQWNNYNNVLLFWRCQEARQRSAQPPTPQASTDGFLVAKNSVSILRVNKKRGIFTKSSAHSPWNPTETRSQLSDPCKYTFTKSSAHSPWNPTELRSQLSDPCKYTFTKSSAHYPWNPTETRSELSDHRPETGQHEDTSSFFEALESSGDHLMPDEKEGGLLTAKQSWFLRLRPLWLLMALACIVYVMVSAVNVYLAPPSSKPEELPLPILTNRNKEDNLKEELGKPSESEKHCDWDCFCSLWN